jgi:mannosyltransferase OCH1-like enzyme
MSFPKIIHVTWKTEVIPAKWRTSWDSLMELKRLFGFQIILWTDETLHTLVKDHYPQHLELYDGFSKNIMRVDIARCFALDLYGGLYMDLDLCLKKAHLARFVKLFESYDHLTTVAMGLSKMNGQLFWAPQQCSNSFMLSMPGAPFWKEVVFVNMYKPLGKSVWKNLTKNVEHWKVINSTGPGFITACVTEHNRLQKDDQIMFFPPLFTAPDQEWLPKPFDTPTSLVTVLEGGSWHDLSSKIAGNMSYFWYYRDIIGVIVIFLLLLVIFVLSLRRRK